MIKHETQNTHARTKNTNFKTKFDVAVFLRTRSCEEKCCVFFSNPKDERKIQLTCFVLNFVFFVSSFVF